MCESATPTPGGALGNVYPLHPCAEAPSTRRDARGSRRRRLWELPHHAHCPVVGVCLSIDELRRRLERLFAGQYVGDDYELHVGAVQQCASRNPISELLQRVFDERFQAALRDFARARTTEQLEARWTAAVETPELVGALWATLTHARCDPGLEERVLRRVHMIQHQAGATTRAGARDLQALAEENATLARELGRAQERCTRLQAEHGARNDRLEAQLIRLRAEAMSKDTLIAGLCADLQAAREAVPELRSREQLARRVDELTQRVRTAERDRDAAREALADRVRRDSLLDQPGGFGATQSAGDTNPGDACDDPDVATAVVDLGARSVLCVGGRHRQIPIYRELVERSGGRFVHHDGGVEHGAQRLDAILAAADLVICQAGCISHNAYWLVKDHCKRTGKRCVYLDKPSAASFARGLAQATSEGA